MPYNPKNQMSHKGLIQMNISADADSTFIAPLDESITQAFTPFEDWWNAKILVDKEGSELTRKTLVKSIRDQDGGGGHVDPELNDDYAEIAKNYSLGWEINDGIKSEPIPGAEKASIRQIIHEVLKTLIPNYSKYRPDTDDTIVGGTASFKIPEGQDPEEFMKKQRIFIKEEEAGRNNPCPCGSGRKYKQCCL